MRYPGYLLNPGDMFQVDVDKVLYATGAPKGFDAEAVEEDKSPEEQLVEADEGEAESAVFEGEAEDGEADKAAEAPSETTSAEAEADEVDEAERLKDDLKDLLAKAKSILAEPDELSVKRKQALRHFTKDARKAMSRVRLSSPEESSHKVDELTDLLERLSVSPLVEAAAQGDRPSDGVDSLNPAERRRFEELLQQDRENPYDPTKPYATPWRPRPYLAPFVFIPRYLEVNQNICAAVYLRHPVARPGSAEVPTPFPPPISQLAHNWYLRRR